MAQQPSRDVFAEEALVHLPALARYARYVLRDKESADDLVQETFFEAWRSFHRYEPGTNCKAWLFRIFRNLLSKKRRRDSRHAPPVELDSLENPDALVMDEHRTPEAIDELRQEEILAALESIQSEYKDVLLLLMEDMAYKDIAEALDIPVGTVMSRIHRGRQALRERLRVADAGRQTGS